MIFLFEILPQKTQSPMGYPKEFSKESHLGNLGGKKRIDHFSAVPIETILMGFKVCSFVESIIVGASAKKGYHVLEL